MTLRQIAVRLLLALGALGLAVSCSSASDTKPAADSQGLEALGRALPGDVTAAAYVDIDGVRAGLGIATVPEDSLADRDLRAYVSYGAPIFQFADGDVLARVIAIEKVREVLSAGGTRGPVMVLRTDQSWAEIRTELISAGYVEQPDEILTADSSLALFSAIGEVDGHIVASRDAELIAEARRSNGGKNDALFDLLAAAPGPIRVAILVDDGGCGQQIAVSSDAPTTGGTWTIGVGPDPTEDRVAASAGGTAGRRGQLIVREPALEGEYLRLPVAFDESIVDPSGVGAEGLLLSSLLQLTHGTDNIAASMRPRFDTYDCPAN